MNIIKKMSKKQLLVGAVVALGVGGSALALNEPTSTQAEDKPPIVIQVENHEKRIGDLETKTDATQAQVDQNTSSIAQVRGSTTTTSNSTGGTSSPPSSSPSSPAPATTAPAPTPVVDPWTITDTQITSHDVEGNTYYDCYYTTYNGRTKHTGNGPTQPCYTVGTILPYIERPK